MIETQRFLIFAILTCGLFLNGCSATPSENIEEIHIEGVLWACNLSTSYAIFGSSTESEDQPEVRLPASDGDLLYMLFDDMEFYYRYSIEDGQHLVVSCDTSGLFSGYLNGRLSYIELTAEQATLDLFSALPEPRIKQLSTIMIREELSDALLAVLKNRESSLNGTGIILESIVAAEELNKLLSICRPEWMAIDGQCELPDPDQSKFLADLELLWIEGEISAVSKLLGCCSNLESMIIANWEPKEGELLPISELKKLHSITLVECSMKDLSAIEFPASLKRLHLVLCDTLSDIRKLTSVPKLKSLILSGCDEILAPQIIAEINSLERLSFPSNISQVAFNTILENQPSLEVVEILDCSQIDDLSVLENHSKLKFLTIDSKKEKLSGLEKLEQLELIVLNAEIFENDPDMVTELRAALPDTKIVPGSGICLGSGWLLLLLPLSLVSYFYFRKEQKSPISEN